MLKSLTLTLTTVLSLLTASTGIVRAAAINNGSFENGFTGWDTIGQTTVANSGFRVTPTDGTYQAVLETCFIESSSQACDEDSRLTNASNLEAFLNLSPNKLTNLGVTEGSAIKQTITVNAESILKFSWNFLTDQDPLETDYNDFAFFTINNNLTQLADTKDAIIPNYFTRLATETGYFSYKISQTGTYTLGFGVVDVDKTRNGDNSVNSALLVDNVTATPIPEPLTILGSLTAIGFGAMFKTKLARNR